MSDMRFFGTYATCRSLDKKCGAHLIGPDNIIGNDITLDFRINSGSTEVWAVNKFGADIGFFDSQTSYLLDVVRGRGWDLHAKLSLIGLTDFIEGSDSSTTASTTSSSDSGYYWAEVAVFAFSPRYSEFAQTFAALLSEKLVIGVRPEIDIPTSTIDLLIKNKGNYLSDKKLPPYPKKKGTVIVKKTRKPSESAIEAGRRGNKGCYFISYLFIAIVVLLIIFGIKTLIGW